MTMMHLKKSAGLLTLTAAALLSSGPARAAIDCWMDEEIYRTADEIPVADARVADIRRSVHAINALLHAEPALRELPRTRLRSKWQIGGQRAAEPARSFHFQLRDHREEVWGPDCSVSKNAERIQPRASIVVIANAPAAGFDGPPLIQSERLTAWAAPAQTGTVKGYPQFYDGVFVFTRSGRLPWVPVTVAEYLDHVERQLDLQEAEWRASQQQYAQATGEAQLQRMHEQLAKTAGKAVADQALESARANIAAAARRQQARAAPPLWQVQREQVRAFRSQLTPQQLAGQARDGWDGRHPDTPPERFPLLVKLDPAFGWDLKHPQQLQILMVHLQGNGEFEGPMRQVLRSLDLRAFEGMVR